MKTGLRGGLDGLFAAIDTQDTDGFLGYLTPAAIFRFGSAPSVSGHDAIRAVVDGFFDTIAGSQHNLLSTTAGDGRLICEGDVTYRRLDDTALTLPFSNVFEMDGELIRHYKIYLDIAPLFAS